MTETVKRSFGQLRLAHKLSLMLLATALSTALLTGGAAILVARNSTVDLVTKQLETVRTSREDSFQQYLTLITHDLGFWATAEPTIRAFTRFGIAWNRAPRVLGANTDLAKVLQQGYIDQNPNQANRKEDLDYSGVYAGYGLVHQQYHPIFRHIKRDRGYLDLFLINPDGDVIYSTRKTNDFGTNLIEGPFADTALAEVFRQALASDVADDPSFSDFVQYGPANDQPVSFAAQAVLDASGQPAGVIAFQIPVELLDATLTSSADNPTNIQNYVVGGDLLLRNNLESHSEPTALQLKADGEGVNLAFNGQSGIVTSVNDAGIPVLQAYQPIDYNGQNWVLISEVSRESVFAPVTTMILTLIAITLAILAVVGLCSRLLAVRVVRPIVDIGKAMGNMARGQQVHLPGTSRTDEIGTLVQQTEAIYQRGLKSARIHHALDGCSTMVMVTDIEDRIVYMNDKLRHLFEEHGDAIRETIPDFDAERLMGASILQFHNDPEKMRTFTSEPDHAENMLMTLGGRRINLGFASVQNGAGSRTGTVIEWMDITKGIQLREGIESVVEAAINGDFSRRIEIEQPGSTYHSLGIGVNGLIDVVDRLVSEFGNLMAAMAKGDLTHKITAQYGGVFGRLKTDTNETVDKISDIVGRLQCASFQVDSTSGNIAASAHKLAARTETTAASLEQTSATATELNQTVKESSRIAKKASELAVQARGTAERGQEITAESARAVSSIQDSSKQVFNIVAMIDEIAFQTNLLALNASVEAARAGEAGKGFAVVATEVRALAQRAGGAATEIRKLTSATDKHVKTGVEVSQRVDTALTDIMSSIGEVTALVDQIAHASVDQSVGVEQITAAVNDMDALTQENSRMVTDSTASTDALVTLSHELAEAIAFFRIPGSSPNANQSNQAA